MFPECGRCQTVVFMCVQTELSVMRIHWVLILMHTFPMLPLLSLTHTLPAFRSDTHTLSLQDTQHIRIAVPSHTCYLYVCGRGSADRLALTVKLAPFSYRCQVFCLAVRGAGGAGGELVSGVLGCCERQGEDGVICRVSLLAWAAWLKIEHRQAQEELETA